MRLIHTSDWHLGRTLHGESLLEHQAAFLEWLLGEAVRHQADVVVVAGDVYDRAVADGRVTPPETLGAGRPQPGPLGGTPRPRPRDDIAGPGHARRLRGARHLPERRGHNGSGAGSGLDQNVQGDHVTPPGLLCLFNPHSPAESSLPQVPAGVDLARFRAR